MKREFSKEYESYLADRTPDLWSRIESLIDESESLDPLAKGEEMMENRDKSMAEEIRQEGGENPAEETRQENGENPVQNEDSADVKAETEQIIGETEIKMQSDPSVHKEDHTEETKAYASGKRPRRMSVRIFSLAACLCIVFVGWMSIRILRTGGQRESAANITKKDDADDDVLTGTQSDSGQQEDITDVSLSQSQAADPAAGPESAEASGKGLAEPSEPEDFDVLTEEAEVWDDGGMYEEVFDMEAAPLMGAYEFDSSAVVGGSAAMWDGMLMTGQEDPYVTYGREKGDLSGETYQEQEETGFSLVATEPVSTFSADVDTASYANVRRMIEDGYELDEIPAYAVRPEEFVNYFSYDLSGPSQGEKFGVTTKIGVCPWNEAHELLMIGLRTEDIDLEEAPAENLTFLLDVSGSMSDDDKLPLVQKAFRQLVEALDEDDTVSIVTYANGVEVVLDGAKGSEKKEIIKVLDSLEASGGTYGEGGIQKAYELAEQNYVEGGNNRILLATDGDLNIGISDPDELEKLITEKRKSGIYLSVLGFGWGNIRDDNMERLADVGNGNYSYIDSLLEAKKVLVEEMGATFHTVADDVKLQIEFNPANVNAYRLIGYENRRLAATDFADDTKDAGEIGAGHSVVALYELIPADGADAVRLKYQKTVPAASTDEDDAYAGEYGTLKIRYKEPGEDTSEEIEHVIDTSSRMEEPDEDFVFASLVTEFAMIISDSPNKGTSSLDEIKRVYKTLKIDDEYKEEFYHLVWMLAKNE